MNKKTVLFLINGFGVQQKDCFDFFDSNTMKNLIDLSNSYMYSTLPCKSFDYKEGYSELSSGSNTSVSYSFLNKRIEQEEYKTNKKLQEIIEKSKNGKLQLFCFLDDLETVYQLKFYIKQIYQNINKKIILNIVLRSKDISQYSTIIKCIDKLYLDLSSECTLGLVLGESRLNSADIKDTIRILYSEITEIWHDSKNKFLALEKEEIDPINVRPFLINKGFKPEDNDVFLFFNYNEFTMDLFLENCKFNPITRTNTNIDFYTLFPTTHNIESIYESPSSDISVDKTLKEIKSNALIMCEESKINTINYYCCGYLNVISDNLSYSIINNDTTASYLKPYISHKDFDLVIINYDIDNCKNVNDLKNRLNKIDEVLKEVAGICLTNDYHLMISSLYGVNEKLIDAEGVYRTINFSTKVPFLFIDKNYSKLNYIVGDGILRSLIDTSAKLIEPSCDYYTLIRKKGNFLKMFKKDKE